MACSANPGRSVSGAASVTFDQPAKLHRGEPLDLIVEARKVSSAVVRCSLSSERTLKTGRVQRVEHFTANILFGELNTPAALPSAFMPNEEVGESDIYTRFFHGPVFRVLRRVLGAARDGLIAEAVCDSTRITDGMHTEPLVLEAAFQAAGLHYMMERHAMALPGAIDAVHWLRRPHLDELLEVTTYWDGTGYHIDVEGQDGPVCRVRGFAMSELGPIPPDKRFANPDAGRPEAFPRIQATGPGSASGAIASATWKDDPTPYLTSEELRSLRSRGTERRVRDRIAGRVAAKRALVALLGIDPLSVQIRSLESGEPVVHGAEARVSITHREGRAMAIASSRHRVGIDAEPITSRGDAFLQDWFTAGERSLMGRDSVLQTAAWSTKEAVLKILGTGMALSPRDIEVIDLADGRARVMLRGEAMAHANAESLDSLELTWDVTDNTVVVQARWAA